MVVLYYVCTENGLSSGGEFFSQKMMTAIMFSCTVHIGCLTPCL